MFSSWVQLYSFGIGFLCKLIVISLPAMLFAYHYYFISNHNLANMVKTTKKMDFRSRGTSYLPTIFISKKVYGDWIAESIDS